MKTLWIGAFLGVFLYFSGVHAAHAGTQLYDCLIETSFANLVEEAPDHYILRFSPIRKLGGMAGSYSMKKLSARKFTADGLEIEFYPYLDEVRTTLTIGVQKLYGTCDTALEFPELLKPEEARCIKQSDRTECLACAWSNTVGCECRHYRCK